MDYDFTKTLYKGEQILWLGESSPNAPSADKYRIRSNRAWGVLWFVICAVIIAAAIAQNYKGTNLAGALFVAAIFAAAGTALCRSRKYVQEYYCLTDKRLLIKDEKKYLRSYELYKVQTAEVTAAKGEYGSIIVFTEYINIRKYKRSFSDRYASLPHDETVWCIRGVRDYDKVCNAINNAAAPLIADREKSRQESFDREPVDGYIPTEKEKAAEEMLKKKFRKRQEKLLKRQEKINRKNGY